MRFSLSAALLAPLLARACASTALSPRGSDAPVIDAGSDNSAPYEALHFIPPHSTDPSDFLVNYHDHSASLELPLEIGDDTFQLKFETSGVEENGPPCDLTLSQLNGRSLLEQLSGADGGDDHEEATARVTAKSSKTGLDHSLKVLAESKCFSERLDKRKIIDSSSHEQIAAGSIDLGITSIRILSIDGSPTAAPVGFTVTYDHNSGHIVDAVSAPQRIDELWARYNQSVNLLAASTGNQTVEAATDKLKTLQSQQKQLGKAIARQKSLVDKLQYNKLKANQPSLRDCDTFQCVISTAFNRAKTCAEMTYLSLKQGHSDDARPLLATEVHVDGKVMYIVEADELLDDKSASHSSDSDDSSTTSASPDNSEESSSESSAKGHIIAFIGAFASVLCVGCLCFSVVDRCSNPRRRVERAARREERRRSKEYRKLTRRKALQDFINTFKRTRPPKNDYEEKRQLIMAQEGVLEAAMQNEMRHLGVQDPVRMAEEGCSVLPGQPLLQRTNTLPTYRTRADSADQSQSGSAMASVSDRPPSYTTNEESASSAGRKARQQRRRTPSGSDVTPDSSIAALTPRHSSETLRSNRSVV